MNRTLKAIAAIMLMIVAVSCNKPIEPVDHSGNLNGHDYVDLGLPSGTLWATCNVGADSIGDYGDRFAWGETSPKEAYNWQNYKYAVINDRVWLLKYCVNDWGTHNGEYGFEGFREVIKSIPHLSDIDINFVCHYFNLQKEDLLCYTRKQSRQARISLWCKETLTGESSPNG